jgi:hypothetical protein
MAEDLIHTILKWCLRLMQFTVLLPMFLTMALMDSILTRKSIVDVAKEMWNLEW